MKGLLTSCSLSAVEDRTGGSLGPGTEVGLELSTAPGSGPSVVFAFTVLLMCQSHTSTWA